MLRALLLLSTVLVFRTSVALAQQAEAFRVPLHENSSNVLEVDLQVNGITSRFIFDPGATKTSFGKPFYDKLRRSQLLQDTDITGRTQTQLANGQLANVFVVKLRNIRLGGFEVHEADALVLETTNAPLLMGQDIIGRFYNVTIDRKHMQLILADPRPLRAAIVIPQVRLVPCTDSSAEELTRIRHVFSDKSAWSINELSEESKIPPPRALQRISHPITVRYFDKPDLTSAKSLQEKLLTLGYTVDQVFLEDMTPLYNAPIPGHLEIWIRR
jgi:hypothetical protein